LLPSERLTFAAARTYIANAKIFPGASNHSERTYQNADSNEFETSGMLMMILDRKHKKHSGTA